MRKKVVAGVGPRVRAAAWRVGVFLLAAGAAAIPGTTQSTERPPAVPLITHDPYFSLWSDTDTLNESPTRHWTGHPQALTSLIRVDGKTLRLMGDGPRDAKPMPQTALHVTPLHTMYEFAGAGVHVTLQFFTPAFLNDLDLLSRPVTYLTWTVQATDGGHHKVDVLLDASPELATSFVGQAVTLSRQRTAQTDVLSVGTREQAVLNRSGDDLRIDWGYFHIAVPHGEAAETAIAPDGLQRFARGEALPVADVVNDPALSQHAPAHLDAALSFGDLSGGPVARHLLVSYTEGYAIQRSHT